MTELFASEYAEVGESVHPVLNNKYRASVQLEAIETQHLLVSEVEGGDFYGPTKLVGLRGFPEKVRSSKRSYNLEDAKKFWEISEELTGIKFSL